MQRVQHAAWGFSTVAVQHSSAGHPTENLLTAMRCCPCHCSPAGPGGNRTATAKDMRVSTTAVKYAKALRQGRVQVYPTKAECCMPNLGAYASGCTAA